MRYTARNVPKWQARWMIRHAWNKTSRGQAIGMGRTIGEACVEVIRDGPAELFVDRIDEEIIFFSVGH
jgi:hypothetical protein